MSNSTSTTSISFPGLLAILFIGLKLTGYISWSWWWVLAPLWIPLALVLFVCCVMVLLSLFGMLITFILNRN